MIKRHVRVIFSLSLSLSLSERCEEEPEKVSGSSRFYDVFSQQFKSFRCLFLLNNKHTHAPPPIIYFTGLAGLPFAGKSGFGAYLHHVPDNGKLLVIFAPHVGIDAEGQIGGLQRDGQLKVSNACGAAIGAYKALQSKNKTPNDPLLVYNTLQPENIDIKFDPQLEQIVNLLAPRLKGIDESQNSISFVTYQMYGIIRELITACITQTDDLFDYTTEIAVVGGVIINRRKGGDFFQPLSFETRKRCLSGDTKKIDPPIDLYEETFGVHPNLQSIMGSKQALDRASIVSS
jgi:hypothetical protein